MGHQLQFKCTACSKPVPFSVLKTEELNQTIICTSCQKKYIFSNKLTQQLSHFEALCRQIHQSKDILGNAAVAIDVGPHHVKIPFQLLLTRLSSVMELDIGGEKTTIAFRVDTLHDLSPIDNF